MAHCNSGSYKKLVAETAGCVFNEQLTVVRNIDLAFPKTEKIAGDCEGTARHRKCTEVLEIIEVPDDAALRALEGVTPSGLVDHDGWIDEHGVKDVCGQQHQIAAGLDNGA